MAKNTRGGLGRGLNSLLNSATETAPRTTERERVVYNDEDVDYSNRDAKLSGMTGSFEKANPEQGKNTRKPRVEYELVSLDPEEEEEETTASSSFINASISQTTNTEKPVEKNVSRETFKEGEKETNDNESGIAEVDITIVVPNPDQPRTNFKKEELEELSSSIKKEGLIQPILVRETVDGAYQIIAGERRWQAAKLAGLKQVPIQVKNVDDDKALELALIENIQRSDLNPIEEAYGYRRLMERRKMTQADVAQAVSKGRSTIANALRLLDLPEEAQQLLFEDKITAGHARAILSIPTKEEVVRLSYIVSNTP